MISRVLSFISPYACMSQDKLLFDREPFTIEYVYTDDKSSYLEDARVSLAISAGR